MSRSVASPRVVLYSPEAAYLLHAGCLLAWDKRVTLLKQFARAEQFMACLSQPGLSPDVLLIDEPRPDRLAALLDAVRADQPQVRVLLLTADAAPPVDLAAGVHGLLVKDEIAYGLASAVWRAQTAGFLYTPSLERELRGGGYVASRAATRLPAWRMCDLVSQRFHDVLRLSYLHAMEAAQIAQLIDVSRGTVHKYRYLAAPELEAAWQAGWYDTPSLAPIFDGLAGSQRWIHLLTSLPAGR